MCIHNENWSAIPAIKQALLCGKKQPQFKKAETTVQYFYFRQFFLFHKENGGSISPLWKIVAHLQRRDVLSIRELSVSGSSNICSPSPSRPNAIVARRAQNGCKTFSPVSLYCWWFCKGFCVCVFLFFLQSEKKQTLALRWLVWMGMALLFHVMRISGKELE